jgi:hypothetical protein
MAEYLKYQDHQTKKKNTGIFFGVNIDALGWSDLMTELEAKVDPVILYCSKYDALSYLRQDILGVTSPQLYLKVYRGNSVRSSDRLEESGLEAMKRI